MKNRFLNAAAFSVAIGTSVLISACASQWRCQPKEEPTPPPAMLVPPPGESAPAAPVETPPAPVAPAPAPLCADKEIAINHKVNTFSISASPKTDMDRVSACLKDNTSQKIRIDGHADYRGTEEYNQTLSEKRANAVREYMISQGVKPENIEVNAYGETKPVASGRDPVSLAKNRQTIITVIQE